MTDDEKAQHEVQRKREQRDDAVAETLRLVRAQVATLQAVTSELVQTLAALPDEE